MSLFRPGAEALSSPGSEYSPEECERKETATPALQENRGKAINYYDAFDIPNSSNESPNMSATNHHLELGEIVNGMLNLNSDGHTTVMTSALLEFYCLSRAADILNGYQGSRGQFTRESPEAKYLAKRMYAYKSQFLSSHGVMAGGIDGEEWQSTRQYYRESLDILGATALEKINLNVSAERLSRRGGIKSPVPPVSGKLAAEDINLRPNSLGEDRGIWDLRELIRSLEQSGAVVKTPHNLMSFLSSPSALPPCPAGIPLSTVRAGGSIDSLSRYAVEFSEVKLLGHGSFGEVYEVKNHVDGQSYAVKKIPLSQRTITSLQHGSLDRLEHIMKEIRTLARLEHPNVVRYYAAWVEHTHTSGKRYPFQDRRHDSYKIRNGRQALLTQESTANEHSFGIVFENSRDGVTFDDSWPSNRLSRSLVDNPHEDEEEEDIESIPRDFKISSSGLTSTSGEADFDIFTDDLSGDPSKLQLGHRTQNGAHAPVVLLHIQMSLHPITLGKYLKPQSCRRLGSDLSPSPRHCFHLLPSLRIILGILAGVEYLHSKGIVHRDLKPANILLAFRGDQNVTCPECKSKQGTNTPVPFPRISDFGLVADICYDQSVNDAIIRETQHVGTKFYTPPAQPFTNVRTHRRNHELDCSIDRQGDGDVNSAHIIDERLDIFALGVIFFELLYELKTKMERQLILAELTWNQNHKGVVLPTAFEAQVDRGTVLLSDGSTIAESLSTCIKGMLEPDPQKRWRCKDVRHRLETMLSIFEKL